MLSPFASLRVNYAKHLLYLFENKQKQIPRYARNDRAGRFFHTFRRHPSLGRPGYELSLKKSKSIGILGAVGTWASAIDALRERR
jgi:hypothetical protein